MTELEMSLLAAGGTLLVGVVAFNKWQEYKAKKTVEKAFASGQDDVLLQGDAAEFKRHEPVLDDTGASVAAAPVESGDVASGQAAAAAPAFVAEKELSVDELIDCVVPIEFDTPVRGDKVLARLQELKFIGKKPVHFIGQSDAGMREEIAVGGAYTCVFAGIQMVRRGGALSELEYSDFITQLRTIADELGAFPEIPDMHKVIATARELHQFVAEHDAQLSVNVASNGAPWDIVTLLGALEKQGFDARPDGRLAMPDGDGGNLFTLSTNVGPAEALTGRLTLLLDVPCVASERDAFGAMAACARSLAQRLGGTVVDDGNQPISKAALDEIAGQVNEFYAAMSEARVPAGSLRAQRLFS